MPDELLIVFRCADGFITDLGTRVICADFTIPRYGVWQYDSAKRKPQVTFTSNDLEECKSKLRGEEPCKKTP